MMLKRLTNLFKSKDTTECASYDCKKLMDDLHLYIDGEELSEQKRREFKKHIDQCAPCFEKYDVEKSLLEAIRTKMDKKCCPDKVVNTIKEKISSGQISTQS